MSSDTKGRLAGLVLIVLLSPIYIAFSHYGQEDRGFVFVCIASVFCAVAYTNRSSLRKPSLAIYLLAFCALQLSAIFAVQLPPDFPGALMMPVAVADLLLVSSIYALIERALRQAP